MICLTCKRMINSRYCPDCGNLSVRYSCECTNPLSYSQKFCEKCGKAVPPKPEVKAVEAA